MGDPDGEIWRELAIGERVRVKSRSGSLYEGTFIRSAPTGASVYMRLNNGVKGRLSAARIDWSTIERLGSNIPVAVGDELIVKAQDGREHRGHLAAPVGDRMVLDVSGSRVALPILSLGPDTLRLLFAPGKDTLLEGEEFCVRSLSGREIRGFVVEARPEQIRARIPPATAPVIVHTERLDLRSLTVLVPVPIDDVVGVLSP